MICPICRSEYRAGFTRCNDCDVTLVVELAAEEPPGFDEWVEVLSTADVGQVLLIKSVLEAEEIPYLAQGEHFSFARNIPVRFLVPGEFLAEVKELLADFL